MLISLSRFLILTSRSFFFLMGSWLTELFFGTRGLLFLLTMTFLMTDIRRHDPS